jgi:hypothetical protein
MWRALGAVLLSAASPAMGADRDPRQAPPPSPSARVLTLEDIPIAEHTAGRPWSISKSGGVLRFEVRQGERRLKASERDRPVERSEIALRNKLRPGVDYAVSYEFMIAPGPRNAAAWVNIGQIHGTEDPEDHMGRGPLLAVQMHGERLQVVARADPQRTSVARHNVWRHRDEADLIRGRWYRMDMRLRIDPHGAGRLAVWRDGAKLGEYLGPLGFNDAVGPYWKLGIYRRTSPEPLAVSFRRFSLAEAMPAR